MSPQDQLHQLKYLVMVCHPTTCLQHIGQHGTATPSCPSAICSILIPIHPYFLKILCNRFPPALLRAPTFSCLLVSISGPVLQFCYSSIRCTWPNHLSLLFLRMISSVSIPVLLYFSFLILSFHVTPRILLCHL